MCTAQNTSVQAKGTQKPGQWRREKPKETNLAFVLQQKGTKYGFERVRDSCGYSNGHIVLINEKLNVIREILEFDYRLFSVG